MNNIDKHKKLLEGQDRELQKLETEFFNAAQRWRTKLIKLADGYDEKGSYKDRDIAKLKKLMMDAADLGEKIGKKYTK